MALKNFNVACLTPKSHLSLVAKPDKGVFRACQAKTCRRLRGASFPKPAWVPYRLNYRSKFARSHRELPQVILRAG